MYKEVFEDQGHRSVVQCLPSIHEALRRKGGRRKERRKHTERKRKKRRERRGRGGAQT
jgi:hypothetical protein